MKQRRRKISVRGATVKGRPPVVAGTDDVQSLFKRMTAALGDLNTAAIVSLEKQLWTLARDTDDAAEAGKRFAKSMNKQSICARAFVEPMTIHLPHRPVDTNLRYKNQMLITKISDEQKAVCELTSESSDDEKWKAVVGLVRTYEGQVRIVNPENARWILVPKVTTGEQVLSD